MNVHYDPKIWDSAASGNAEFNVELNYDIDTINYTSQRLGRRAKTSTSTSDTNSDSTSVSWFSGLFSSLYPKPMTSSMAIAHGFIEDENDENDSDHHDRHFSFQSLQNLHTVSHIPVGHLSSRNSVHIHLSTPSLRYTKQCCPEPPTDETSAMLSVIMKRKLRKYKLELKLLLSSSPQLVDNLRSKFKSQWKKKRLRSLYTVPVSNSDAYGEQHQHHQDSDTPSPQATCDDDTAPSLYHDEPDPDPFAKLFGPYRVALD